MTRTEQIADAYLAVARANHYMVTVETNATWEELNAAKQRLIDQQNAGKQHGRAYKRLDLALDLIERDISNRVLL
jgi:hypothetical protein